MGQEVILHSEDAPYIRTAQGAVSLSSLSNIGQTLEGFEFSPLSLVVNASKLSVASESLDTIAIMVIDDIEIASSENETGINLTDGINDFDTIKAEVTKGNFSYVDTDDIAIDHISASGDIILTAQGSIADHADDSDIDIISGSHKVSLSSTANIGGFDSGDQYLELDADTILTAASTNMGNIAIHTPGNINLKDVSTVDGKITVDATGLINALNIETGDIGDNNSFDIVLTSGDSIQVDQINADKHVVLNAANRITGTKTSLISGVGAVLTATNGIGTDKLSFNMAVNKLDAMNTISGGIYVNNLDDLTLTDLNNDNKAIQNIGQTAMTVSGQITQDTTGYIVSEEFQIQTTDTVSFNADNNRVNILSATISNGDFTFINQSSIALNEINVGGEVTLSSLEGSITSQEERVKVSAGDLITLNAAQGISNIQLADNSKFRTTSPDSDIEITALGDLILDDLKTGTGNIIINAFGDISASNLLTTGGINIQSQTGDIKITQIQSDTLTIVAHDGSIVDLYDDKMVDIQSNTPINLSASAYILNLDLADETIINATAGNDILLNGSGNIVANSLISTNGKLAIIADGIITSNQLSAKEFIFLEASELNFMETHDIQASESINLFATGDIHRINVKDNSSLAAISETGSIDINAMGKLSIEFLTTKDGSIDIAAQDQLTINKALSSDALTIQSQSGNVLIGSISANDLTIQANQGSILDLTNDSLLDIQANELNLQASANITDLEIKVNNAIEAISTKAGDITLYSTENIVLQNLKTTEGSITIKAAGDIDARNIESSRNITLLSETGDLLIHALSADNLITLISNTGSIRDASYDEIININNADFINISAGYNISNLSISGDTTLDARILGYGNIGIHSSGNITLKHIETYMGGVFINAENTITAINVNTESEVNLESTSGDILINQIVSGDAVTLTATSGQIFEFNDDADADISAAKLITLNALSGIHGENDDYIEFAENSTINATVNAEGIIKLQGTGALNIQKAQTQDGEIDIKTSGNMIAQNIISGVEDANFIRLQSLEGDIKIGQIHSADEVTIMANKGSIIDLAEDNLIDITAAADTIKLLAAKDIGSETNLEIAAGSEIIAASTEKGAIHLHGLGNIVLNTLNTADGSIQISADGIIQAMSITANDQTGAKDIVLSLTAQGAIETGIIKSDAQLILTADTITKSFGNISAQDASFISSNGIGSETQALELTVNQLSIHNTNGDFYIQNTTDLELAAIENNGTGWIESKGAITITDQITQEGDLTLIADAQINIQSNIQADSLNLLTEESIQSAGTIEADSIEITGYGITQTNGNIHTENLTITSNNTVSLISDSNSINNLSANVAFGDMIVVNQTDINIDQINAQGEISLTSTQGSLLASDTSMILSNNETVTLNACNDIDLNLAENMSVTAMSTNFGNINLSTTGDLTLETITTSGKTNVQANAIVAKQITSGSIELMATDSIDAGHLTAENRIFIKAGQRINDISGTIQTNELVIQAMSGIGTERNVLTIDANQLDVTNIYEGSIYITDQDDLTLKDLNDDDSALDTMVTGKIITTGKLDIIDDIRTNQNFELESSDQINIESNIINSGKDDLTLSAINAITQKSGTIISNDGTIQLEAKDIIQQGGELIAANAVFIAQDHVSFTEGSNDIDLLTVQAGSLDYRDKNDLQINTIQATGNISITATTISDRTDTTSIQATNAILTSEKGMGSQDNPLNISVRHLDITNKDSGNIYISNSGDLNLKDLNQDGKSVDIAGGGLIETHSPLSIDNDVYVSGTFTLSAASSDSENDNLTIDASIINLTAGEINLHAGNNITQNAGIINGKISMTSGSIIQTGGSLEADSVKLNAIDLIDIQGDNNQVNVIQAIVESGDFMYKDKDSIAINQITAGGSVTIDAENIIDHTNDNAIDIQSGSKIILTSLNAIGETNKYLELADNSTVKATANAGDINLYGTGSLTLEEILTQNGTINITAESTLIADNIESTTEDHTITLSSITGDISIHSINAYDNIFITTDEGNIIIDTINTTKSIQLTSTSGAIQKSSENSTIKGDQLSLTAKTGINISTNISEIDAIVLGAGDILIDETDNVILKALTTFEGSIAVNSGGSLEAIHVRSVDGDISIDAKGDLIASQVSAQKRTHLEDNNITLSTIGGNMIIDMIVADNNITINIEDGALIGDNDTEADIQAKTITGKIDFIKDVNIDVSNYNMFVIQTGIIPYLDYIPKKQKTLEYPQLAESLSKDFVTYLDEEISIISDTTDILENATIDFSLDTPLIVDEISEYEVKWEFDEPVVDPILQGYLELDDVDMNSDNSEKTKTNENSSSKEHGKNVETDNKAKPAIFYNKEMADILIQSEKQSLDVSYDIPAHIISNQGIERNSNKTDEKPVVKHLSVETIRPKQGLIEKMKNFFSKRSG